MNTSELIATEREIPSACSCEKSARARYPLMLSENSSLDFHDKNHPQSPLRYAPLSSHSFCPVQFRTHFHSRKRLSA
jgi:hypothetical protein